MIKLRDYNTKDSFEIEDIHNSINNFPMTDLNHPCKVLKKTVLVDDKIVGTAYVHLTTEVGMILDKTLPILVRAKIIKEIFTNLIKEMKQTDIEDVYIFVTPENDLDYVKFLKHNFGFEDAKGIGVYRRIDHVPASRNEQEHSRGECNQQPSSGSERPN